MAERALAVVQADAPALFTDERTALIRKTIANNAPELEFQLFMEVCKRTGLDPISRQIYFIQRGGRWQWQTSIDGYRLIADRTGNYAGSDDAIFEEGPDGKPIKATVTVWKFVKGQRCPFTATARWAEYNANQGLWGKMPHTMLAKCAEALALRKAFPAELSGLYTREEMEQADSPQTPVDLPVDTTHRRAHPGPARSAPEYVEAQARVVQVNGHAADADTGEIVVEAEPEVPEIKGFTQLWPVLRRAHGFKGTRKDLEALIGPFGEDDAQLVYERYLAHLNGRAPSAPEDGKMTPEQKAANKEMWRAASSLGIKDNDALKDVIRRLKREWAGIESKRELTAQDMLDIADMLDSMEPAELQQLFEGGE